MGRWSDGEIGRWGDGGWGDREIGRWGIVGIEKTREQMALIPFVPLSTYLPSPPCPPYLLVL